VHAVCYLVVDVYTEICGPCIPMVANLKKVKMDLGAEILHYAIVNIIRICIYVVILCLIVVVDERK